MNSDAAARSAPALAEDARLNPWRKSIYGTGDFTVNAALSTLSMVYATYFLLEVAGLRPELAGAVQLIGRAVDAFTDPAMGRISDLTRSRFGRRRPFLLLGALPFGISFALLWAEVPTDSQWALFAYYSSVYVALSVTMTMVSVPYLSLQPEMATGYDARTSLNTYRNVGSVVGVLAAVAFRPVANALGGGAAGFAAAGSVFGVLLALPWFAVFAVTWERPDFQARPPSIGFREGLRLVSSHRSFRQLVSFFVCGRIAMDLAGAMMILYFTHVLARSGEFERMLGLLMGTVLLCMPLWLRLSRHSEKSRMFMFGACWWAAAQVILLLAQPDWPIWTLLVFAPLTGVGYAAVDLMPWSMVGEVVDEDELRSGERQEGLYYGFFTFLRKLTGTIAVSLALGVLGAVGFTRGEQQSESTVDAIRLLAGLGPMLFLLASVWIARGYPLTRARHAEILAELARRRAET